jgi:ketosteroid isomerase-like protein/uncharacterized protein YbcV (DUF1398 family)
MHVDHETAAAIEECARASHAGTIRFGAVVAKLLALGVESYHADYRRGETTYYLPGGATHAVPLPTPELAVAEAFSAEGVREAVGGAQRGEVRYPDFVRRTMAAGCIGYWVWLAGRHVVYHGRRGEAYVEPFPGQAAPAPQGARGNVEVVKQVYEAFRRRDLAALPSLFSQDIEIDQSSELPWGGHYVGQQGVRDFFARLTGLIDSTLALERFVDAGDHVVAIGWTRGAVRRSGCRYDVPIAHVWTVQGGRVTRVHYCIDNPTMRAALEGQGAG